jgi:hypothetical protein
VIEVAQQVEELVQKDVDTFLELYRKMRTGDHGYFERYVCSHPCREFICKVCSLEMWPHINYMCICRLLSNSGVPKSPFRDRFVWSCQLGTIFAGSCIVGYLKSE